MSMGKSTSTISALGPNDLGLPSEVVEAVQSAAGEGMSFSANAS